MWKFRGLLNSNPLRSLFAVFLILIVVGIVFWSVFPRRYYIVLPVTYDGEYGCPLVIAELEGKQCTLALSVGSRFPLFLGKETLYGIDKQPQGIGRWNDLDGSKHEASTYLIPKLTVGDLRVEKILAYESEQKDHGVLGKFLGKEWNLLLDFSNDRVIACETFSRLFDMKLVGKDWIIAPFERVPYGIIFHVNTDFGTCRLALATTSAKTYLRSSLIAPDSPSFITSSFSLGGTQFGSAAFLPIDLPEGLRDIDGVLGMDFLKEHDLYIDLTRNIAYIAPPKPYFAQIPVTFTEHNTPSISVSIEENIYPLDLDLGSPFSFSLSEEVLQNIKKTKYGTARWSDFKWQKYESPAYRVPNIQINGLVFEDMLVGQVREEFHKNATLKGSFRSPAGVVGLPILKKYNLFLDFRHCAMYASSDCISLQRAGLLSQNLLTIPFTPHPDGVLLSIETDAGIYRLILDTGATTTLIRAPQLSFTKKFGIQGHDFGERSITSFDLHPELTFDGLLGMDFLREYSIFIDYTNKVVFIDLEKDHPKALTHSN